MHNFDCTKASYYTPSLITENSTLPSSSGFMKNFAKHTPYLLIACNHNDKKDGCFTLYSIADKINYEFDVPFLHKKLFIGSQYDSLVVLDQHCEPFLLNPLTGDSIPLPSITTLRMVRPCHSIVSGDVDSYFINTNVIPGFPFLDSTFDECLREVTFTKVIVSSNPSISSSNFTAAALFSDWSHLVVTREGEGKWNLLQERVWYMDIMFCKNGKLLCVTNFGALHEVEFKDNDDIVITEITAPFFMENCQFNLYLAEDCAGRVLIILRKYDVEIVTKTFYAKAFRFMDNGQEGKWEPLLTLDGEAIFVGTNASVSLSTEDIHGGICPDTIYFTDEWWDILAGDEVRGRLRDICAYNLINNSIEACCPSEHQQCTWPLPIWIYFSGSNNI